MGKPLSSTTQVHIIGVDSWTHHYRAHNKMADHFANKAMDAKASAQDKLPTRNHQLDGWEDWIENDIKHWIF